MHPALLVIASLPLIFRVAPLFLPGEWLEPYAYWSSASLNAKYGGDGVRSQWRNLGWWKETDAYPRAAEALARKLLDLADVQRGGNVLDIAHGAGDSLALHLSDSSPPAHLFALTSLPSETLAAQSLVSERFPNITIPIDWFTGSATFERGKDLDHPLNPMRGYVGQRKDTHSPFDADFIEANRKSDASERLAVRPSQYDLVYILDAIYHFPPSVPYFLASVLPTLRSGTGIIAYTDILPPPNLNAPLGYLVLPTILGVPARNLMQRPKSFEEYQRLLEKIGFEEVVVEDWSEGVWKGLGRNLRDRGGVLGLLGRGVEAADRGGWKFIAVRARRPA